MTSCTLLRAVLVPLPEAMPDENCSYPGGACEPMCEGRYGGLFRGVHSTAGLYYPEYGSSFSALVICWVGLHMLLFWGHDSALLHAVAANIFVNGWASLGYHWTNGVTVGLIDKFSMLLTAWLVAGVCFDELTEVWFSRSAGTVAQAVRHRRLLRNGLRGSFWCFSMSIMWIVLGLEAERRRPGLFEATFAVPLIFSLVVGLVTMQPLGQLEGVRPEDERRARGRFFVGVGVALTGVTCWLACEQLCDSATFFRWFPGHVVWHVTMSWGLMHTLIWGAVLRANNFRALVRFYEPPPISAPSLSGEFGQWLGARYFLLMPAFDFTPDVQCRPSLNQQHGQQLPLSRTRQILPSPDVSAEAPAVTHVRVPSSAQ